MDDGARGEDGTCVGEDWRRYVEYPAGVQDDSCRGMLVAPGGSILVAGALDADGRAVAPGARVAFAINSSKSMDGASIGGALVRDSKGESTET